MKTSEEKYLLLRIAKGDREAFSVIFRLFFPKVYKFILSLVKREAEAKDIAQDVFIKIWIKRKKLRKVESIDNYLFISARNSTLDFFRKASVKNEVAQSDIIDSMFASQLSFDSLKSIEDKSKVEYIKSLIEKMPPRRRDIFMMSRFDGIANDDIASIMGISKKTVENQLYLATDHLKKFS